MPLPRNIALIAPAMGSGKSTVASHLWCKYGYDIIAFADPLRMMIDSLLKEFGIPAQDRVYYLRVNKEAPIHEIPGSPTARRLMQLLGTEWGRDLIHGDLWVASWEATQSQRKNVVADDCRRLNEYEAVRRIPGSQVWRITRPGATVTTAHASEGQLDNVPVDAEIVNDGTLQDLFRKVDLLMEAMP
jgi:hypothetical protein